MPRRSWRSGGQSRRRGSWPLKINGFVKNGLNTVHFYLFGTKQFKNNVHDQNRKIFLCLGLLLAFTPLKMYYF